MKQVLVIDNYDSFTYNLVQIINQFNPGQVTIARNDQFELPDVDKYDHIVISPGPGIPDEAGEILSVLKHYGHSKSILGICLGHQAIAQIYGGRLLNLDKVVHGKATPTFIIDHENTLFLDIPPEIVTGRYHSWIVDKESIPSCLKIIAADSEGEIMAICHQKYRVWGLQFHPESIMTGFGSQMIFNWLKYT